MFQEKRGFRQPQIAARLRCSIKLELCLFHLVQRRLHHSALLMREGTSWTRTLAILSTADTHFGHGGALGLFRQPFASVANGRHPGRGLPHHLAGPRIKPFTVEPVAGSVPTPTAVRSSPVA